MANKGNGLPSNLYKKMLTQSYLQNQKDSSSIKNFLIKNRNPILQKEDRYIPPRTKGNILTEEYYKKMVEKPEKNHMKRIPLKANLGSGVKVIAETKKKTGIKMNPKVRRNQNSTKSYELNKHLKTFKKPDSLKNFYLDNFNSVKENQYELARHKTNVSKNHFIFLIILQRRFLCRPKDNIIIPPQPLENPNSFSQTFSNGFKRPLPTKTYDRIFNTEKKAREFNLEQEKKKGYIRRNNKAYRDCIGNMFEEQGKITKKMPIIAEKPCNDNFRVLSAEAKKNMVDRYYYDNNLNQW